MIVFAKIYITYVTVRTVQSTDMDFAVVVGYLVFYMVSKFCCIWMIHVRVTRTVRKSSDTPITILTCNLNIGILTMHCKKQHIILYHFLFSFLVTWGVTTV